MAHGGCAQPAKTAAQADPDDPRLAYEDSSARPTADARLRNAGGVKPSTFAGAIIAGFDVHLRQITFDCIDSASGEIFRGRIASEPAAVRDCMAAFPGREVHVAVEACTGWLFVAQAVQACGGVAHLAETVETRALRGRKRRAKTDRQDALWLRELLAEGRLPESWIAPSMCASGARGCTCEKR